MKLFVKLLKWFCIGIVGYPLLLVFCFLDSNGNVSPFFWLEILIIDLIVILLLFLFTDFELVRRIKERKKNQN